MRDLGELRPYEEKVRRPRPRGEHREGAGRGQRRVRQPRTAEAVAGSEGGTQRGCSPNLQREQPCQHPDSRRPGPGPCKKQPHTCGAQTPRPQATNVPQGTRAGGPRHQAAVRSVRQRRPGRSRTAGESGPLVGLVPPPRCQRPALRLTPSGPGIPTPSCALGRPLQAQPLPAGPGPRRTAFREGAGGRPGAPEQS